MKVTHFKSFNQGILEQLEQDPAMTAQQQADR